MRCERSTHLKKTEKKKESIAHPPWTEAGSRDTHRPSSKGIRQTRPASHGLKLAGSPLQPLTVTQSRISPPVNFPKRWEPFQRHLHSTIGYTKVILLGCWCNFCPCQPIPTLKETSQLIKRNKTPRASLGGRRRLPLPPSLLDEQEDSNALNTCMHRFPSAY
ncbi:hypothetical protein LI328DRAFT_171317 [Trichoderma asperelloides]|nr:hypothetical protein LI328DRAFT_171317 [Trichoderma asperelloides]